MRVAHISDTHGTFPEIPEDVDLIVHSGDFLPNKTRGLRDIEPKYQRNWLGHKKEQLRAWIGKRKFVICKGNHDFFGPLGQALRNFGIDAYDITNSWLELDGLTFYGFPYIPYIIGEWNYEAVYVDMVKKVQEFHREIVEKKGMPKILVAHSPLAGFFDTIDFREVGNAALSRYFMYDVPDRLPEWFMCGHIHYRGGIDVWNGMKISQAACRIHLMQIE